jgi:phosphoglycerate dehydrogenase-like enzyme
MPNTIHISSSVPLNEKQKQQLQAVSSEIAIEITEEETPNAQTQIIFYNGRAPISLDQLPQLRWVQVESAGVNHLHNTPLWNSDITITSANGVHSVQIPEYVLATLLAHAHHLPLAFHLQTKHEWGKGPAFMPTELRGATIGILGYGAIGREVARLAAAFGMRVLATKRADRPAAFDGWTPAGTGDLDGSIPERYYEMNELPALLAESDVVVLTLPLSPLTRHVIGEKELAAMRPHAFLINIGRGPLIDQDALYQALSTKQLGGAALDVTDPEPLPAQSPLWDLENLIITPHISGASVHYTDRSVAVFAENLRRSIQNEPLLNVVQRSLGY